MGITVDIDTGGTFTDGLFTDGKTIHKVKVETTPHDLTVGLLTCILEGAKKFGFTTREQLLENVDVVRWTSTIATNVIAERKGPKIGLIVSQGQATSLYSQREESEALDHLVQRHNIEEVMVPIDGAAIVAQIKAMLEKGVRRICVSLKGALQNPASEQTVKRAMEEQFPEHYLGNVPALLGSDICKHPDDMTRTNVALLNAYVHSSLARGLFKAEDDLRECGYEKPLLIGSIHGGVARVAKTKPMDTIESGPIFGIHAAAHLARSYGLERVITLDVGGTTTKMGVVYGGKPKINPSPELFGIPIKLPLYELTSVALGGGTVARPTQDGTVVLGPESMGAYPGPACYDLGGSEATLTDAFLVTGLIDPNYFAGGKKILSLERAKKVIGERVAGPLGIGVQAAAARVTDRAATMIADHLKKVLVAEDAALAGAALFAFGGNGGLLGCPVAQKAGLKEVYVFELGPVLSAFGSSVAEVVHVYEHAPFVPVTERAVLSRLVGSMVDEARRDMRGEGFDLTAVSAQLEFALADEAAEGGGQAYGEEVSIYEWSVDEADLAALMERSLNELQGAQSAKSVGLLCLRVKAPAATVEQMEWSAGSPDVLSAPRQIRAHWSGGHEQQIETHQWEELQPRNRLRGPTVLEGVDTTVSIPVGWDFEMDTYRTGKLTWREH